jgi:isoquinoline 1-oxidoreductase beta subunit
MKVTYGTSFPAPENRSYNESAIPAAAGAILGAPRTSSEIGRLTREAYARLEVVPVDRRTFLGTIFSAGALVLGATLAAEDAAAAAASWQPSVYVGFEPNGQIVITAHRSEMGTGSRTSLPLVLAEELDVDWKAVRVEQAIGDAKYGSQNTDGSCSVRDFVQAMHEAGATARLMLERAAAQKWSVPANEVSLRTGKLTHSKSGRTAPLGDFVAAAAALPLPSKSELQFRKPTEYRYIGKNIPALDQHDIVSGKAVFGMDAVRPGMLYAAIERPPVYDSKLKSFDDAEAKKVKGVVGTVALPGFKQPHLFQQVGGVAVLADSTWAAMQARKKLRVDWDLNSDHATFRSDTYRNELFASVHKPGKVVRNRGDFDSEFDKAPRKHEADYYVPMLAHAAMEPPVAVAEFRNGKVEAWCPTQNPQAVQEAVAAALSIKPADVTCHVTLLGGGFGRKSKPDYVVEARCCRNQPGSP